MTSNNTTCWRYPLKTAVTYNLDSLRESIREHISNVLGIPTGSMPPFVDEVATARILGVRPNTLQNWRCTGRYNLPYTKVGKLVRYPLPAIVDFIIRRTHGHGG